MRVKVILFPLASFSSGAIVENFPDRSKILKIEIVGTNLAVLFEV